MYRIELDFDAGGDPPHVFIIDSSGTQLLEVFEEPIALTPEWSWESKDWKPGLFAERLLKLINEYSL